MSKHPRERRHPDAGVEALARAMYERDVAGNPHAPAWREDGCPIGYHLAIATEYVGVVERARQEAVTARIREDDARVKKLIEEQRRKHAARLESEGSDA